MATVLQHKRSGTSGDSPAVNSIALGEIAINTTDGHLYIKKDVGGTESIVRLRGQTLPTEVAISVDSFTGDGSTVTFTTSRNIQADQFAFVTINGVQQQIDVYSVFNNSITFAAAPIVGDNIEVRILDVYGTEVVLRDNKKYYYTITSTANTVSGADDNGITLAYDTGHVDVFQNGVKLIEGSDFTATNGTSVLFTTSLENGDIVEVISNGKASFLDSDALKNNSSEFVTTTANQIADTFSVYTYRSAKYIVQATSGSAYHVTEVMLIHDGTTVYLSEYGTVQTTAQNLMTIDADIINGNVRLLVTPALTNTTVKTQRITVTV